MSLADDPAGIQCGKVVIIGLDLGSFIYAEASMDAKISINWLRTRYRMQITGLAALSAWRYRSSLRSAAPSLFLLASCSAHRNARLPSSSVR